MVLGRRTWAWPFPLASEWQLEGCGSDGLGFPTIRGCRDVDWPPGEYCSDSSCSTSSDAVVVMAGGGEEEAEGTRSEMGFERRIRRDSEGPVAPASLPWHRHQSEPNLVRQGDDA